MSSLSSDNSIETKGDDLDSLMEQINAPSEERAMSSPESLPSSSNQQQPPQTPQQAPTQQIQEYEFDWNGKKIKAPIDKLTKWASQGYDYSQRMAEFKLKQQEVDKLRKEYEKYKTIDDYVKKDPQWWSHVEQSYQNRLVSDDPYVQRMQAMMEEKLKPFETLLASQEEQKRQAQIQSEDTALASEMKSIREKYKDLDFDTLDGEGKSLEYRVLEHGAQKGFPSYRAAFLDFYHDQLEKMWEARGREAISKDVQKRQKLGLSATSPTPQKKSDGPINVRGKSYNDLQKEIYEQLGL